MPKAQQSNAVKNVLAQQKKIMHEMPQKRIMASDCHNLSNLSVREDPPEEKTEEQRQTLYLNQKTCDTFYQKKEGLAGRQTKSVLYRSQAARNADIMDVRKRENSLKNNEDLLPVTTQHSVRRSRDFRLPKTNHEKLQSLNKSRYANKYESTPQKRFKSKVVDDTQKFLDIEFEYEPSGQKPYPQNQRYQDQSEVTSIQSGKSFIDKQAKSIQFAEEYGQLQHHRRKVARNQRQSAQNFRSTMNDLLKHSGAQSRENLGQSEENKLLYSTFDRGNPKSDITDQLMKGIELRMALPSLSNNIETYLNWKVECDVSKQRFIEQENEKAEALSSNMVASNKAIFQSQRCTPLNENVQFLKQKENLVELNSAKHYRAKSELASVSAVGSYKQQRQVESALHRSTNVSSPYTHKANETPHIKDNRKFSKNTLLVPDKTKSSQESLTTGILKSSRRRLRARNSHIPSVVNDYEIDRLWQKQQADSQKNAHLKNFLQVMLENAQVKQAQVQHEQSQSPERVEPFEQSVEKQLVENTEETKVEEHTITVTEKSHLSPSKSSTLVGFQTRKFVSLQKPKQDPTSASRVESPQIIRNKSKDAKELQQLQLDKKMSDSQEYMVILGDQTLKDSKDLREPKERVGYAINSPTTELSMSNLKQRYGGTGSSRKEISSPKSKSNTLENVASQRTMRNEKTHSKGLQLLRQSQGRQQKSSQFIISSDDARQTQAVARSRQDYGLQDVVRISSYQLS